MGETEHIWDERETPAQEGIDPRVNHDRVSFSFYVESSD